MHRCLVILLCMVAPYALALELPPTWLSYEIEVQLEPDTRRLEGRETIRWTNPSSSTVVDRVPLHLYLNGFSHEDTTWMRTNPGRGVRADRLIELFEDPWGWSEPRAIRQGEVTLAWTPIAPDDGNLHDRSLIEVQLADPVGPGETLTLTVEFEARLPVPFARAGGYEDFFLVAQWFPKVAVFETVGVRGAIEDGWNAHQFHGPTEFYADFADFDVRIGVPAGWTVVATGEGELDEAPAGGGGPRYRFRQRAVHDFAFAAGSIMAESVSSHDPQGEGGPVAIHVFLPQGLEHQLPRWTKAIQGSLDVLGSRIGPYPYATLTVVLPPFRSVETMGMEYPTFFTGSMGDPILDRFPMSGLLLGEETIAHEFAHQYFYAILGTNEFEEAFLDEGCAEYWGLEAMIGTYGDVAGMGELLGRPMGISANLPMAQPQADQHYPPIRTRPTYLARGLSQGTQFYMRPAAVFKTAAALFGQETLDRVFAAYFDRWAFKHPRFEDLIETARDTGGEAIAEFLLEAFSRTRSPDFRIAEFDTDRWRSPRGRLVDGERVFQPGEEREGKERLAGLDPAAREDDESMLVEIVDPGYGGRHEGRIERRSISFEQGEPDEGWKRRRSRFYVSEVRLAGPGWEHLPVEVLFRFADGAVVRESWDGRATYRGYRFLRRARLSEVQIDPDGKIALDPDPVNNGRLRKPDPTLAGDWSTWLPGLFQLLAEGVAQWL